MSSGEILGHDVNGRPLRAGDEVVMTIDCPGFWSEGQKCKVIGPSLVSVGEIEISIPHKKYGLCDCYTHHVRKLDNHQAAGSFDEVMAGLKQPQRIGESQ